MAEIDLTYVVAPSVIAVTTVIYSYLRLKKEERKVKASEAGAKASVASFQAMTVYHSKRLEIEEEKLELARGNASTQGVHVREHPRTLTPTIDTKPDWHRMSAPPGLSDEEFFAKIKWIRETYK